MNVLSKYVVAESRISQPQQFLGGFDSVPYTCHELAHTWTSSCTESWVAIFKRTFWFSLKLYVPLYLISAMWQYRKGNVDRKKIFNKTVSNVLRSSIFLAMNGASFVISFCVYRAIFGKFHGVVGYVTGFVSSFFNIMIEQKSRRQALGVYAFNLALETVFRMLLSRGYVYSVSHGEIYLFAFANMLYLGMFRGGNLPPFLQNMFGKLLGTDEAGQLGGVNADPNPSRIPLIRFITSRSKTLISYLNKVGPHVQSCCHTASCSGYIIRGAMKFFLVGYGLQILTQYHNVVTAISRGKLSLLKSSLMKSSIPKFLCAYITLFRFTNCLLRWIFGRDHPGLFGCVSSFVAGLSSALYPSTSITMYAISKTIEILVMKAVSKNWFPYIKHFDIILYSLSMAVLSQACLFEPHNIRPAYWKMVIHASGGCVPLMFRMLLDKYGTRASKLYPNFVPNLDVSMVQTDEVKRILSLHGKWPCAL